MQIEAGKYYRTRDGQKVGPMMDCSHKDGFRWCTESLDPPYYSDDGCPQPGTASRGYTEEPIVAEWTDEPAGPVRTRTVTEIVSGVYGRIEVYAYRDGTVGIRPRLKNGEVAGESFAVLTAAELSAAAAVFVQLADALEGDAS